MQKRFNKNNVIDHISYRLTQLEQQWGFKSDNGYAQVQGADFQKVMAYGMYEGYLSMIDTINYNSF